ncbi:hypothetical protein AGMMS49938_14290 [Fibrobacterales bacterium]|nr:hypothetical protein AGMMS49938_14290 [Fibrobacterales bacterium]
MGIAFASEEVGIAFPRETIDVLEKNLWAELSRLVAENKITDFVLGMPIHPNGNPEGKQKVVSVFAGDLKIRFPTIELHLQDESYSTITALSATSHLKKKDKRDKGRVDKAAAAVILQRFLEGWN